MPLPRNRSLLHTENVLCSGWLREVELLLRVAARMDRTFVKVHGMLRALSPPTNFFVTLRQKRGAYRSRRGSQENALTRSSCDALHCGQTGSSASCCTTAGETASGILGCFPDEEYGRRVKMPAPRSRHRRSIPFVRRYSSAPLDNVFAQIDPLIRELTVYRDFIISKSRSE